MATNDRIISEEMVKLIFTPLRESLADMNSSVKDAANETKLLFQAISSSPKKSDLKESIDHLIETIKYDFTNKTQLLEVLFTTKLKESTDEILNKINDFEPQLEKDHDKIHERLDQLISLISPFMQSMDKLAHKIDVLIIGVSIAFTLSLIAWGCISYFFNINIPGK